MHRVPPGSTITSGKRLADSLTLPTYSHALIDSSLYESCQPNKRSWTDSSMRCTFRRLKGEHYEVYDRRCWRRVCIVFHQPVRPTSRIYGTRAKLTRVSEVSSAGSPCASRTPMTSVWAILEQDATHSNDRMYCT